MASLLLRAYRQVYLASPVKKGLTVFAQGLHNKFVPDVDKPELGRARLGYSGFLCDLDLRDRMQFMMYVRGTHETNTEALVQKGWRSGGVFVDIGAHLGYYSLLVANSDRSAQVYCFEPHPALAMKLRNNLKLNHLENVHFEQIALGNQQCSGYLIAADFVRESGWNCLCEDSLGESQRSCPVTVKTLDKVMQTYGSPRVDWLKIDVEGYEHRVFEGAVATLSAPGERHLIVEFNFQVLEQWGSSAQSLHGLLKELGYQCHQIVRGGRLIAIEAPTPSIREMNYCYSKQK